jgi:hypothetical protein
MKPKVHFQSIRRRDDSGGVIIGTLCNRLNVACEPTPRRHEVTCKFCLRLLMEVKRERAA